MCVGHRDTPNHRGVQASQERERLEKGGERFQNGVFGSMRREILAEENINFKIIFSTLMKFMVK
jgi:hypothetical protein